MKQTFICECGAKHERVVAIDHHPLRPEYREYIGYLAVCDPCHDRRTRKLVASLDEEGY